MEEIRNLLFSQDSESVFKAIKMLRDKSNELLSNPDDIPNHKTEIENFLLNFQNMPTDFDESDWNMIIFALCTFYLSLFRDREFLQKTFNWNGYGPLFCILNNSKIGADVTKIFNNIYELFHQIIKDESNSPFYSIRPELALIHMSEIAQVDDSFEKLRQIESLLETSNMKGRTATFYNIVIDLIEMLNKRKTSDGNKVVVNFQVYKNLLDAGEMLPEIICSPRFCQFFNNFADKECFEVLADAYYSIRNHRANFPDHIVVKTLCNVLKKSTQTVCLKISSFLATRMNISSISLYKTNDLLFILPCIKYKESFEIITLGINCSLSSAIEYLSHQSGICSDFDNIGKTSKGYIPFAEQAGFEDKTMFFDDLLISKFDPEVASDMDSTKKHFVEISSKLKQIANCMFLISSIVKECSNSVIPYNFSTRSTENFVDALFKCSRVLFLLQTTGYNGIMTPYKINKEIMNNIIDYIKSGISYILNTSNSGLTRSNVSNIFAFTIIREVRKYNHSYNAINFFTLVFKDDISLLDNILCIILKYFIHQIEYDASNNKVQYLNELFQVFLFTLRIGSKLLEDPKSLFTKLFIMLEKPFIIHKLFNLLKTSKYQKVLFDVITVYYRTLRECCKITDKNEIKYQIVDSNKTNEQIDRAKAKAYVALTQRRGIKDINEFLNTISEGLKSDDINTVICASQILRENINIVHNKDHVNSDSIRRINLSIMEALPKLPTKEVLFLSKEFISKYGLANIYTQPYKRSKGGLTLPETTLSITKILYSIYDSKIDYIDVMSVFSFVKYCFSVIRDAYGEVSFSLHETLDILHVVMCALFNYPNMVAKVNELYKEQHILFAELIAKGCQNDYFLSLISASTDLGISINHYALRQANIFLAELKKLDPPPVVIERIFIDMLTYFSADSILKATSNCFGVLQKNFEGFIKFRHLKVLLQTFNQKHDRKSIDKSTTNTFSRILHEVIKYLSDEDKKKFMTFAFNYGENMLMFAQNKLIKRMSETGLQVDIDSISNINCNEPYVGVFKVCAALACGYAQEMKPKDEKFVLSLISKYHIKGSNQNNKNKFVLIMIYKSISIGPFATQLFLAQTGYKIPIEILLDTEQNINFPQKYRILLDIFKSVPVERFKFISDIIAEVEAGENKNVQVSLIKDIPTLFPPKIIFYIIEIIERLANQKNDLALIQKVIRFIDLLNYRPFAARPECLELMRSEPQQMKSIFFSVAELVSPQELPFGNAIMRPIVEFISINSDHAFNFLIGDKNSNLYKLVSFIEQIILEDTSKKLLRSFSKLIVEHIADLYFIYIDIISFVSHYDIIRNVSEFADATRVAFKYNYNKYLSYDILNPETSNNLMRYKVFDAFCYSCIANPIPEDILTLCNIFKSPIFRNSAAYSHFIHEYDNFPVNFRIDVLYYIAKNFSILESESMSEVLLKMQPLVPYLTTEENHHIADHLIAECQGYLDIFNAKVIPATQIVACLSDYQWSVHPEDQYNRGPVLKLYSLIPMLLEKGDSDSLRQGFNCLFILDSLGNLQDDLWVQCVSKLLIAPTFNRCSCEFMSMQETYRNVKKLLKMKKELLTPLPKEIADSMYNITNDLLLPIRRFDFKEYVTYFFYIINDFPELISCLPYSPYIAFANSVDLNRRTQRDDNIAMMKSAITILKCSPRIKEEEKDVIFNEIALTMDKILNNTEKNSQQAMMIDFAKIPTYHYHKYPHFLIETVKKRPDSIIDIFQLHIIMQSVEFLPKEDMLPYFQLIRSALIRSVKHKNSEKFLTIYTKFYRKCIAEYGLQDEMKTTINSLMTEVITPQLFKVILSLMVFLLDSGDFQIDNLFDLWNKIQNPSPVYFNFLCESILNITGRNKIEYATKIAEMALDNSEFAEVFLKYIGLYGKNPNNIKIKNVFLKFIPYLGGVHNATIPSTIVDLAKDTDPSVYVPVLITYSVQASSVCCSKCIKTVQSIIPDSPMERFNFLNAVLPTILWSDKFIIPIMLIISPSFPGWDELTKVVNLIPKQRVDLVRFVLNNLIEIGTEGIPKLLNTIVCEVSLPKKDTIKGFALAIEDSNVPINPEVALKITKKTADVSLSINSLSDYKVLEETLLPNRVNDFVLATHMHEISKKASAAAIQLILSNPEESMNIFSGIDPFELSNPTTEAILNVASKLIVGKGEQVHEVIKRIINKGNCITDFFENARMTAGVKYDLCLEKLQSHKSLNITSVEILMMIQSIRSSLTKETKDPPLETISPYFSKIVTQFVENKAPDVFYTKRYEEQEIVFPPQFNHTIFKEIIGYTKYGEIVVGNSLLNDAISVIKASNNDKSIDSILIARFYTILYWKSLDPNAISNILKAYILCIRKDIQHFKPIHYIEAVSRILTFSLMSISDRVESRELLSNIDPIHFSMWINKLDPILKDNCFKGFMEKYHYMPLAIINAYANNRDYTCKMLPMFSINSIKCIEKFGNRLFVDLSEFIAEREIYRLARAVYSFPSTPPLETLLDPSNMSELAQEVRNYIDCNPGVDINDVMDEIESQRGKEFTVEQFNEKKKIFDEAIDDVNTFLPITLEGRTIGTKRVSIIRFTDEIKRINEKEFLITYISDVGQKNTLILHRRMKNCPSRAISVSVLLGAINSIFNANYATVSRGLHIRDHLSFEVGYSMVATVLEGKYVPVTKFFNTDNESEENIELCKRIAVSLSADKNDLVKRRVSFIRSLGAASIIPMFLRTKPSYLLMSNSKCEFFINRHCVALDCNNLGRKIPAALKAFLGDHTHNAVAITVAASAKALLDETESFLAPLETSLVQIGNIQMNSSQMFVTQNLANRRDAILEALRNVTPPMRTADENSQFDWLSNIDNFLL